jgi:hypothetical protein
MPSAPPFPAGCHSSSLPPKTKTKKEKQIQRDEQISLFLSLSDLSHKQLRRSRRGRAYETQPRSYVIANISSSSSTPKSKPRIRQEQIDVHGERCERDWAGTNERLAR